MDSLVNTSDFDAMEISNCFACCFAAAADAIAAATEKWDRNVCWIRTWVNKTRTTALTVPAHTRTQFVCTKWIGISEEWMWTRMALVRGQSAENDLSENCTQLIHAYRSRIRVKCGACVCGEMDVWPAVCHLSATGLLKSFRKQCTLNDNWADYE